jgi:hypothetical protein
LLFLAFLPTLAFRERIALLHILAVTFFPILGVGIQAKFFPYHYGAIIPLWALPAGWGFWKVWQRSRPFVLSVAAWLVVVAVLRDGSTPSGAMSLWQRNWARIMSVTSTGERREHWRQLLEAGDINASNRRVASWIAQNTKPDQAVFIWGFEPIIYDLAGRPSASRYIYNVPQRVAWGQKHRAQLMADLSNNPPAVFVVERLDTMVHVTGNTLDSVHALLQFPELVTFLHSHYRPGPRFGDLTLFVRT